MSVTNNISHALYSSWINIAGGLQWNRIEARGVDPSIPDDQSPSPLDWAQLNYQDESMSELSFLDST